MWQVYRFWIYAFQHLLNLFMYLFKTKMTFCPFFSDIRELFNTQSENLIYIPHTISDLEHAVKYTRRQPYCYIHETEMISYFWIFHQHLIYLLRKSEIKCHHIYIDTHLRCSKL